MGLNDQTYIFHSMSSLARRMCEATAAARKPLLEENQRLRFQRSRMLYLIDFARKAIDMGELPRARELLELAEKASRGEK